VKLSQVVCPISNVKMDENVGRVNSFLVSLLILLFVATYSPWPLVLLAVDFAIRGCSNPGYSPLRWLAVKLATLMRLPVKRVDAAPKLFSVRLGLLCTGLALLFLAAQQPALSVGMAVILVAFTLLDSLANLCVGCILYHYVVFPFYHGRQPV
jgi:hypothetical protein